MRTSRLPLALLLALLAPASARAADAINCVGLEVALPGSTVTKPIATPRFSATQVVDLALRMHAPATYNGQHVVQFRVFTPQGHLYQALDVPVVDPAGVAAARKLPGYPFPVKEARPRASNVNGTKAWAIEAAFPVGGTAIVSRGIYGIWSVNAFMDTSQKPLCAPASFVIIP